MTGGSDTLSSLQENIKAVEKEIRQKESEIENFELRLRKEEISGLEKTRLEDRLHEKEKEKNHLREKENHLREEKNILLRASAPDFKRPRLEQHAVPYNVPDLGDANFDDFNFLNQVPHGDIYVAEGDNGELRKRFVVSDVKTSSESLRVALSNVSLWTYMSGKGEAMLHSKTDAVLHPYRLCLPRVKCSRDCTAGTTIKALRPDAVDAFEGVSVLHVEEKQDDGEFEVAERELTEKLLPYDSIIFGVIPWFLGLAVSPSYFDLFAISWCGTWDRTSVLGGRWSDVNHRLELCVLLLRYGTLLSHWSKQKKLKAARSAIQFGFPIDRSRATLVLTADSGRAVVKKTYHNTAEMSVRSLQSLTALYQKNSSAWPKSLEQPVKCESGKSEGELVVYNRPVCSPFSHHEGESHRGQLQRDIGVALRFLHDNGYVHCDVRRDNVLWDSSERVFVLVDLEYVRRVGSAAPKGLRVRQGLGDKADFRDDVTAAKRLAL